MNGARVQPVTAAGRLLAWLLLASATLLGGVSLAGLALFLYVGSLETLSLHLSPPIALALDALLCVLFFAQHSVMIRRSVRRHLLAVVPAPFHRALYAVASGAALLAVLLLWQRSEAITLSFEGPLRWALRAAFTLAILGFGLAVRAVRCVDPIGLQPIRSYLRGDTLSGTPLTTGGPYRWVRHPLYSLSLVLFWSCPDLTLDRLLFSTLWSAWVVVASLLEERDLLAEFGAEYRAYQKSVPMLIPWRLRRR